MTWFKVDDNLAFHPKVLAAGNAAMGLWVRAGSWSAQQLTDGRIPDSILLSLGTVKQAESLARVGLWTRAEGAWQFHGWSDVGRQPTRATVEAERAASAERQRKHREEKGLSRRDSTVSHGVSHGDVTPLVTPTPTRPDPTRPLVASNEARDVAEIRPDVSRLCNLLADLIEANGSKRPTIGKGWHDAARLMVDTDKRPLAEIVTLIQWAQADSFWRGNILSMPKFRDKYDTLRLQRETKMKAASSEPTRAPRRVVSGRVQ